MFRQGTSRRPDSVGSGSRIALPDTNLRQGTVMSCATRFLSAPCSFRAECHSQFYDLMGNRGVPIFAVFDVVWLDGEDLRDQPLSDRKETLRDIVPESPDRMLYVDHIEKRGTALYEQCCSLDYSRPLFLLAELLFRY